MEPVPGAEPIAVGTDVEQPLPEVMVAAPGAVALIEVQALEAINRIGVRPQDPVRIDLLGAGAVLEAVEATVPVVVPEALAEAIEAPVEADRTAAVEGPPAAAEVGEEGDRSQS